MAEFSRPITFRQLLAKCPRIEVPLIQRDYAQGRDTEKDVRDDFLKALHGALDLPPGDPKLPLNLDFVYGSMEGGSSGNFLPLDGQQRLTTLFLLHWYLAWRDGKHSEFESILWDGQHSRFTYGVRPSSTEFFDELVRYVPHATPDEAPSVRRLVEDQPWFFLHWRLDPTIQSVLEMLDAIHGSFKSRTGLFPRLVDDQRPAITFELLPLEHFGLTDDLYIKMNARGKPLTPFETFKARFEELLKDLFPTEKRELGDGEVSVAEFFERRIDTRWTDFFWAHKNPQTHTFDELIMNLLLALARVSLDPASARFSQDTALLRERQLARTFSLFHEHGWLTRDFASNLMQLLEAWSRGAGKLASVLPSPRYFDEAAFFQEAIQEPAALDYTQLVQFAAFVFYLRHHGGSGQPASLSDWMRVVRNLATNSDIERPEEYGRSLAGLLKLLPHSAAILQRLSDTDLGQIGFSPQQVREEVLKARLILANGAWRDRIDRAEEHGYFSGQIEFLLDFCGITEQAEKMPAKWNGATHEKLQAAFDGYFTKARMTFDSSGLVPTKSMAGSHLWKRALLTVGDYLPSNGSNYSFLTNPQGNWDSWKRFLRGGTSGARQYLKTLWDRIDANADIEPQLEQIIAGATSLEAWRSAIIRHPEVISYCGQQEMRRGPNADKVYLLTKKQMSGYHAELFSYALYLGLADVGANPSLAPLRLEPYQSVYMSDIEPYLLLVFDRSNHRVNFAVESAGEKFRVHTSCTELRELPEVKAALCDKAKFAKEDGKLMRLVPRAGILQALQEVSQSLTNLPNPTAGHA
jgi:Protein of unknown function DUF262